MKRMNVIYRVVFLTLFSMFIIGCDDNDDDDSGGDTIVTETKYVVGFQAINAENGLDDYVLELDSLDDLTSGEITVEGQGTPLLGWRFFHQGGETVFTAGYLEDVMCRAYGVNDEGILNEFASFTFESTLDNFSALDESTIVGVQLSGSANPETFEIPEPVFHIINTETGFLEEKVQSPIDNLSIADADASGETAYLPWITGMVLRNDKLFISYHKLSVDGSYTGIDTDRAFVAVYNYSDFELEKIIYNENTGPIGVNGHSTGIESTENGDIYSYSSSAETALITGTTKPSGILRINDGETEFDEDYFFDVENAANGGKLFWMDYVGNGKAIGRIILDDTTGPWSIYAEQGDFFKLVVLDLEAQTVTDVEGVPSHANRYTAPMFVEDGIAYLTCRSGGIPLSTAEFFGGDYSNISTGETFVYAVDPKTATATKGAELVNGISLKGIFKISN